MPREPREIEEQVAAGYRQMLGLADHMALPAVLVNEYWKQKFYWDRMGITLKGEALLVWLFNVASQSGVLDKPKQQNEQPKSDDDGNWPMGTKGAPVAFDEGDKTIEAVIDGPSNHGWSTIKVGKQTRKIRTKKLRALEAVEA